MKGRTACCAGGSSGGDDGGGTSAAAAADDDDDDGFDDGDGGGDDGDGGGDDDIEYMMPSQACVLFGDLVLILYHPAAPGWAPVRLSLGRPQVPSPTQAPLHPSPAPIHSCMSSWHARFFQKEWAIKKDETKIDDFLKLHIVSDQLTTMNSNLELT